jgi:hypothetical protein
MVFTKARINSKFNGKIYTHGSGEMIYPTEEYISNYLLNSIKNAPFKVKGLDYFISILWGDSRNNEMMDFFGYTDVKKAWKGNPDIFSWVIKNGVWRKDNNITCGDGMILLGKEEEFRRKTKNIEEYMKSTLDLNNLNKLL